MPVHVNLKLGEVNNLSDARYAAGAGAAYVGFALSPGRPQYTPPEKVMEITGWLQNIIPVAEWEREPAEVISDTCRRLNMDHIQLNFCDPAMTEALQEFSIIQNFILDDGGTSSFISNIDHVQRFTHYYMLSFQDAAAQDAYLSVPAHRLIIRDFCRDFPVFLNFHFNKDNLLPIIQDFLPYGINLKGGAEVKPGYKDFDALNELTYLLTDE
jgi:phosphoribosylanthranilate isomerase